MSKHRSRLPYPPVRTRLRASKESKGFVLAPGFPLFCEPRAGDATHQLADQSATRGAGVCKTVEDGRNSQASSWPVKAQSSSNTVNPPQADFLNTKELRRYDRHRARATRQIASCNYLICTELGARGTTRHCRVHVTQGKP